MEPFGEEVIQRLKSEKNVICIKGNHERWALERRRRRRTCAVSSSPVYRRLCRWASTFRARPCLAGRAAWPLEGELEGVRVAMWHARPGSDVEGVVKETTGPELRNRLLEQSHAQILIVGHTHVEFELMGTSSGKY